VRNDNTRIIQIYCGFGKGKTTSAVGQTLRAVGNGFFVVFIQFLKSRERSGEINVLEKIPGIEYRAFGTGKFLKISNIQEEDHICARSGIECAQNVLARKAADMLVLDEIGPVLEFHLIPVESVLELFKMGDRWLDIVLTGRSFPESIMNAADLVTRMDPLKHHFDKCVAARRGIEF